jgi:esterase/lipase
VTEKPVNLKSDFDPNIIGLNINEYLKKSEQQFPDIKQGVSKKIIWANKKNTKTLLSIVYIHGFTASLEEVRPLPDLISKDINANLYYTRLSGHGRSSNAMNDCSIKNWMNDLHEAIEIGSRIGEKVIIISSSTGATISVTSALNKELSSKILGYIFISPNFGINNKFAGLISWPLSNYWLKIILGKTTKHSPRNELNKKYWTMSYPTNALIPMAKLVNEVNNMDYSNIKKPALFYFSMEDKVVNPYKTKKFISGWGGQITTKIIRLSKGDDKFSHVLAGYIISPNQTEHARKTIVNWIRNLK